MGGWCRCYGIAKSRDLDMSSPTVNVIQEFCPFSLATLAEGRAVSHMNRIDVNMRMRRRMAGEIAEVLCFVVADA